MLLNLIGLCNIWIIKYYPNNISMFALDPFLKVFKSHITRTYNNRVILMFVVNNAHVYPIYESNLQHSISKAKEWKFEAIKFNIQSNVYHKINKYNNSNNALDHRLDLIN
jgi:hypothetical protein